jgi:hypothetical protein
VAAFAVGRLPEAFGSTAIFTGAGDGTSWGNASNWTTGGAAGVAPSNTAPGDDLSFNYSSGSPIDLGGNRVSNSLAFATSTTLGAAGTSNVLTVTSGDISVPDTTQSVTATINAQLVSSQPLDFSGQEYTTFTLNNLSGGTTTVASTLNSSALITISGGDNEVHSDGLITTNALAFTGNTTPTVQLYSDASLPGQIVLANGGNLSFTGQGTAQLLSVGNSSLPGVMNLSGTSNHTFTIAPGATVLSTASFTNGGFNLTGGGTLQLMGGYRKRSSRDADAGWQYQQRLWQYHY